MASRTAGTKPRIGPGPRYDKSTVLPADPRYGSSVLPAKMDDEPGEISARTLRDMDEAVANLKEGKVSEPVYLSDMPQEGL